ncbi:MAG: hypothetical protein KF760_06865 [Candidatus Eremiobacteraeota bacterium]|nr:hypothetical protein [Candidatus Eremiobacteraeota bacterium]MCW5866785.1 hypothetical protein [Candidatus Eremiobacteraeota bacterium]
MQGYGKSAAELNALPFQPRLVHRLNAPFVANWSDFPTTEELIWNYYGLLTRLFDVNTGYNLCLLTAHLSAAAGLYVAARMLGSARVPAIFCAVCYSTSRYLFVRDSIHLNLCFIGHVPFFWLAARWLWRGRPLSRKLWLSLISLCAVTGWQHPYYWYFWLVMLLPCWLVPALCGRWRRAAAPALLSAASVFFLSLGQIDSLMGWIYFGKGLPFERTLNELQLYGLRLPEFFLPAGHRLASFDQWAYAHYFRPMMNSAGEMDSLYLGFLVLATVGYLIATSFQQLRNRKPLPFVVAMSLWLFAVMICGGLNFTAGSLGLLLFRCPSRISIVLQAGWLLFLSLRLSYWKTFAGWRSWLLLPILVFNCWDCMPPYNAQFEDAQKYVRENQDVLQFLEHKVASHSMIFQWPVMDYPEAARLQGLWHYEEMTAYVLSRHLRFSYGDCRLRPETVWQKNLEGKSPESIVREVESYGFSALWLYRKGLKPAQARLWEDWRKPDFVTQEREYAVYLLRPAARPVLPKLAPTRKLDDAFYGLETDSRFRLSWRWVWGKASIQLLVPSDCKYRLRFGLSSLGPERTIRVLLDGKPYDTVLAPARWGVYRQVTVDLSQLKAGSHRLDLIPDGPALPPLADGRRLTFQYINESLEPLAGP